MLGVHPSMPPDRGIFLDETWRLHLDICRFTTEQYYEGRLKSLQGLDRQRIEGQSSLWDGLTQQNPNRSASNHGISPVGSGELPSLHGLYYFPVEHEHNQSQSREESDELSEALATLLDGNHYWVDAEVKKRKLGVADILVVAPYNAQVSLLKRTLLEGVRVGTVDRFQGQEAPLVVDSMTTSTAEDAPRGMEFLYSPNRFNVATSRARSAVFLFGSPKLFKPSCMTPEKIRLANGFCRFAN